MPPVDSSSDLPQASATGTFVKTPLAHLLVYAYERELTGTFELTGPNGEAATVLFLEGQPTKARTTEATAYLGRVLFELGVLTDEQLESVIPGLLASTELHGQALLRDGLITEEQLELGLRAQLVRQMKALVRLPPETTYKYYDSFDGLASYGGDGHVGIDPFPIVWGCIRDEPPWEHIQLGLQRIGAAGIRLTDASETSRFAFDKLERATIDLLRQQPWRLQELVTSAPVAPNMVHLIVYCLLVTKQVELVRESKIPGAPPSTVAAVPDAPASSPFGRNVLDPQPAPAPKNLARLQLEKRPVTRAPVVVEERTSAESLPSDAEDGRTSYVATQPRSFTKKRSAAKIDPPVPDPPPSDVQEISADPISEVKPIPAAARSEIPPDGDPPSAPTSSPRPGLATVPKSIKPRALEVGPLDIDADPFEGLALDDEPAVALPSSVTPASERQTPPSVRGGGGGGGGGGDNVDSGWDNLFEGEAPKPGLRARTPPPPAPPTKPPPPPPPPEVGPEVAWDNLIEEELSPVAPRTPAPVAAIHTMPTVPKMVPVSAEALAQMVAAEAANATDSDAPPPSNRVSTRTLGMGSIPAPQSTRPVAPSVPPASPRPRVVASEPPRSSPRVLPPSHAGPASTRSVGIPASRPSIPAPPSSTGARIAQGPAPRASTPAPSPLSSRSSPISVRVPFEDDAPPSSRSTGPASIRAMQMTAELVARKKEILDKAAAVDKEDHYGVLGVTPHTPSTEVQKAFFALAKKWHPDRVPPVLIDVKDQCAKVFARMSEAHQILMDPGKRAAYDASKRPGGGGDDSPEAQAQVQAILEAAMNFQKAEICLKRNDFKLAEELCRRAIAVDPKQADYITMMAWLEAQKPNKQDAASVQAQVAELTRAIAISPVCERAFFYRGTLLKRSGQEAAAIKDFKRAMDLNPRNVDAQREVRLFNMRGGDKKTKEEGGGGGIFGKLFKK